MNTAAILTQNTDENGVVTIPKELVGTKLNKESALTPFQQCIVNGGREELTYRQIFYSRPLYGMTKEKKFSTFKSELSTGFYLLENTINRWEKNGIVKNGVELMQILKEPMAKIHGAARDNEWKIVGERVSLKRPSDAGTRGRKAAVKQDFNALAAELGKFVEELTVGDVAEKEGIEMSEETETE